MAQPKIKDLPTDIEDEAWALAEPYLAQAVKRSFAEMKDMGITPQSETGELAPETSLVMLLIKRTFTRTLGEMVRADRRVKSEIDDLRKEIQALKGKTR